ncbi:MAG TPA: DinB family protein [Panacibacter sp.]|nr:DinB family protein [Panacibacter sp.]HNP44579.1 DinB family protein [Panacibacter sp.]
MKKITDLIADNITSVFEGGNWTEVNLKETLSDVDYREATTATRATFNTIAALVHHLTFYNSVVISRLSGEDPEITAANGFDMPPVRTEFAWEQLKNSCLKSGAELAAIVKTIPQEKLCEPTVHGNATYYKTLHGISEHAHYHLGQIVILKKLLRQSVFLPIMSNSL